MLDCLVDRARHLYPHRTLSSVLVSLPLPVHSHAAVRVGWSDGSLDPEAPPAASAGVAAPVLSSLPPNRLRIGGGHPIQVETEVVALAWRFGARAVSRWVFARGSVVGDAFDQDGDRAAAVAGGYVAWMFEPMWLGSARRPWDDPSLRADGSRDPAALVPPRIAPLRPGQQTVIRLGTSMTPAPSRPGGRRWNGRGVGRHPGDGKALVTVGSVALGVPLPDDDPRRVETLRPGGAVVVKLSKPFPARDPVHAGRTLQFAYLGDPPRRAASRLST